MILSFPTIAALNALVAPASLTRLKVRPLALCSHPQAEATDRYLVTSDLCRERHDMSTAK
jgi:hypothetical protein